MNFLKRFHWFELALITVVMGVHIYAAFSAPHNFSTRWFTRDDAYYYFKVAQNVSEGRGSTFDGINPTNGYHPLWMLACVPLFALARFDLILPLRLLMVVMAALSAATSILLFRLLKKAVGEPIAMLTAAYWALDMNIHGIITQQGMETGVVALSVLILLTLMQRLEEQETLTRADFVKLALAALFVLFSRLDGIYLALIAGVWMIFRRSALRWLAPVDLLLTLGVVVGAYLQRAGLDFYQLVFAHSAITLGAITFGLQALVFYFSGLYEHPKNLPPAVLLRRIVLGTALSAGLAGAAGLALSALNVIELPRAVPLIYGGALLMLTLATRFAARAISLRETHAPLTFPGWQIQIKERLTALNNWLAGGLWYYGLLGGGLLIYMGINRVLFGTFMPVSGQIKQWWGSLPNNVYGGGSQSVLDMYTLDPLHSQSWDLLTQPLYDWARKISPSGGAADGWYWLALSLVLGAWLFAVLKNRHQNLPRIFSTGILPLWVSAALHGFVYGALAYAASHEWYWVMQMLTLVLLAALGLRALLDLLPWRKPVLELTWGLTGLVSLALASNFAYAIVERMPYQDPLAGQPYMDMLPTLEGFTEPGGIIGMTGGGNAGYFIHDRTIVNMDGLINSYAYFQALKTGQGGKYLARMGMGYVFANYDIVTASMPYVEQFSPDELTPVPGAPAYGRKELLKYTPKP